MVGGGLAATALGIPLALSGGAKVPRSDRVEIVIGPAPALRW